MSHHKLLAAGPELLVCCSSCDTSIINWRSSRSWPKIRYSTWLSSNDQCYEEDLMAHWGKAAVSLVIVIIIIISCLCLFNFNISPLVHFNISCLLMSGSGRHVDFIHGAETMSSDNVNMWLQIRVNKDDIDNIKSHGGAVPPEITNKLNQLDTQVRQSKKCEKCLPVLT